MRTDRHLSAPSFAAYLVVRLRSLIGSGKRALRACFPGLGSCSHSAGLSLGGCLCSLQVRSMRDNQVGNFKKDLPTKKPGGPQHLM